MYMCVQYIELSLTWAVTDERADSAPRAVGDIIPPPIWSVASAKSFSLVTEDVATDMLDANPASAGGRDAGGGASFGLMSVCRFGSAPCCSSTCNKFTCTPQSIVIIHVHTVAHLEKKQVLVTEKGWLTQWLILSCTAWRIYVIVITRLIMIFQSLCYTHWNLHIYHASSRLSLRWMGL